MNQVRRIPAPVTGVARRCLAVKDRFFEVVRNHATRPRGIGQAVYAAGRARPGATNRRLHQAGISPLTGIMAGDGGHGNLPVGGHRSSPLAATGSPHGALARVGADLWPAAFTTLKEVGPSTLLGDEQERIRYAADNLIFSRDVAADTPAREAMQDIERLCRALVNSGR
jgi:hypothetical protein